MKKASCTCWSLSELLTSTNSSSSSFLAVETDRKQEQQQQLQQPQQQQQVDNSNYKLVYTEPNTLHELIVKLNINFIVNCS